MDIKHKYLVISDTNNVIDYLYSTTKYKFIRGASMLLDSLNIEETRKIAKENNGNILSTGGGEARILFEDLEDANKYIKDLRQRYLDYTDEITLSIKLVKREENESFAKWIERAELLLRINEIEEDKLALHQVELSPIIERCGICKRRPAEKEYDLPYGKKRVCLSCYKKAEKIDDIIKQLRNNNLEGNLSGLMDIYKNLLDKSNPNRETWIKNINELLKKEEINNRYIGFVYMDGKDIGKFYREKILDENLSDEEMIEKYKKMSEGLHKATIDAAVKTANEYDTVPVDYAMVGGDDFIALIAGEHALPYSVKFIENFENETKDLLADFFDNSDKNSYKKFSMAGGVVISKVGYPVHRLFSLSYDLMNNTKQISKANPSTRNESYIDFHVITDTTVKSIDYIRSNENKDINGNTFLDRNLRMGGYSIKRFDSKQFISYKELEEKIKELKKNKFPRTKIKKVYEIVREENNKILQYEWLLWRSRLDDDITNILDNWNKEFKNTPFPFNNDNSNLTPLLDLFDIYDFVKMDGENNE